MNSILLRVLSLADFAVESDQWVKSFIHYLARAVLVRTSEYKLYTHLFEQAASVHLIAQRVAVATPPHSLLTYSTGHNI